MFARNCVPWPLISSYQLVTVSCWKLTVDGCLLYVHGSLLNSRLLTLYSWALAVESWLLAFGSWSTVNSKPWALIQTFEFADSSICWASLVRPRLPSSSDLVLLPQLEQLHWVILHLCIQLPQPHFARRRSAEARWAHCTIRWDWTRPSLCRKHTCLQCRLYNAYTAVYATLTMQSVYAIFCS